MSEGGGPAPLYRHNTLMDVKSQKRSFALLHFKPGLGSCGSSASAVHSTSALLLQWAHTGTLQVGDHNHVSRKYVHVRKKSNCIGAKTLSQVLGLCWEQRGAWRLVLLQWAWGAAFCFSPNSVLPFTHSL